MKILAIDSTGKTASGAILDGEKLVGEAYINTGFTHSETLMPLIQELLQSTKTNFSDIDKLAVTVGPGSFTGIRIGVATVKGLAFTEDKSCVPLSTLEVLAESVPRGDYLICPTMDARRNQVYTAIFECKGETLSRICEDKAVAIEALLEELKAHHKKVYLLGDGATLCEPFFQGQLDYVKAPEHKRYQRALYGAILAKEREGVSAEKINPVYLRLSQAERESLQNAEK